ncbi:GNAT family N-acetyltransferase [Camelliibacillus cellulosilyticus]|uniref:GNAT family N-acetyltransferase n=1 Tax=Camelliibacillus cellulosilyticus TaxID=2174486 RepID=A0ABV9GLR2_9BACL
MEKLIEIDGGEATISRMANLYQLVWPARSSSIKVQFMRHTAYKGYKGLLLLDENGELLGFSYGYTSLPGQFYRDKLEKSLNAEQINEWLTDCFEFVELVVHPNHRKKGYGKRLLNQLLAKSDNQTAVLTTQTDNHAARSLYASTGWSIIKEPFIPFEETDPFVIMGKRLN